MCFNAIARPIIGQHTLNMQCARLETLVIFESAHVGVVALECYSGVAPRLLHDPNREHREREDDEYADPGAVRCQRAFRVGMREQVMQHVHVVLQMVTSLGNVNWAVLTVQQVLLIKVLQPLLIVFALTHKVKRVVLVVQVCYVLGDHRDATHVDCQPQKSALEQQIHVAVHARMRTPVIHFEFFNEW